MHGQQREEAELFGVVVERRLQKLLGFRALVLEQIKYMPSSPSTRCSVWARRWPRSSWRFRRPGLLVGAAGPVDRAARPAAAGGLRPAAAAEPQRRPRGRTAASRRGSGCSPAFAVLYGICETMNGNWSQQDMTTRWAPRPPRHRWLSRRSGPWSPSGRLLFAAIAWLPPRTVFRLLPFVLVGTFVPHRRPLTPRAVAGIAVFGARRAGLLGPAAADHQPRPGCLPRVGRRGRRRDRLLPGGVRGRGLRRRPARRPRRRTADLYGWTAVAAAGMALLSFVITRHGSALTDGG